MPKLREAYPQISVRLFKTISRQTIDGAEAVSARYRDKDGAIDLTPFLGIGSAVRTTKSVREPAGGFTISFSDRPQQAMSSPATTLETIYGLVEPMDVIEIRMWRGLGNTPKPLPIIMRGFVSDVRRDQTMMENGQPQRTVTITGQDYGKVWQTFQVLYLAAYANGKPILTNFALFELFGVSVVSAMKAGDFVREMIDKIINPHIAEFMPANSPMPKKIQTGSGIAVQHGMVNNSFHRMQGSIYDILKFHGDVGYWNELYTEDREDGVHVIYRPIPALTLSNKARGGKKIQDDAPDPIYVTVPNSEIVNISVTRSDSVVGNFFWVNNSLFDIIDDMQRKLASIPGDSPKVLLKDYPNAAVKYYGIRAVYGNTQQGGDPVTNMNSGEEKNKHKARSDDQEDWIDKRRRLLMEMNRDNVVFERGTARIKGGPMRGGAESMKAGDYVVFQTGSLEFSAYVVQIDHEFLPLQGYTTTLTFERSNGFAVRTSNAGSQSPWLAEQSERL